MAQGRVRAEKSVARRVFAAHDSESTGGAGPLPPTVATRARMQDTPTLPLQRPRAGANARDEREAPVPPPLDSGAVAALADGTHGDPFAVLGPRPARAGLCVRAFLPGALGVEAIARDGGAPPARLVEAQTMGLFSGYVRADEPYLLRVEWPDAVVETEDPYSFGPCLSDAELDRAARGAHPRLVDALGARPLAMDGVPGVRFSVWAPNARRVAVVGDFNG
jgi:1,4-alpha-glucan branching enzyme